MTAGQRQAMKRGRERAAKQKVKESRRLVRDFRAWLAKCQDMERRGVPLVKQLRCKPPTPTDEDYRRARR